MKKVKQKKNYKSEKEKNYKSETQKNAAKTKLNMLKSDKGGDIVLHPAAAPVAAGARGLPSGWACLVTPDGYFIYYRNILWGC